MNTASAELYRQCVEHVRQAALLSSIDSALGWDERTMLPAAAGDYRAEQISFLAGLVHDRWIDAKFGAALEALAADGSLPPEGDAAVTVRLLKRQRDKQVKLPKALVEELSRLSVVGQQTWVEARRADDFSRFAPVLSRTVELKREQADALGHGGCRYDALLDDYEPYALTADVAAALTGLREELVPLVAAVKNSGRSPGTDILSRPYPAAAQEQFARQAAERIGFDFQRGRLDVTAHPFCTTLGPHDCRITTRYDERDFANAFFGVLHEAGHGLYEQGLPAEHFGFPLGEAASLGVHESQSRLWENFVGRSRAYWQGQYPAAQRAFPAALGDVSLDRFYAAVNDVRPSLIRTESDEATYNLHICVRFELEQALLDDRLTVADLPAAWNEKYQSYVGVSPPNDADGVLQDVHWSAGLFGYFPTYTLGNLAAAQFFDQASADLGELPGQIARGEFRPLLDWLRTNIHRHGRRYPAADLVRRVTGQPLGHASLMKYLRAKLSALYGL